MDKRQRMTNLLVELYANASNSSEEIDSYEAELIQMNDVELSEEFDQYFTDDDL